MADDLGVSPVIGTVLVLGIFISVTSAAIYVAKPQFDDLRESGVFKGATTDMARVSSDIRELSVAAEIGAVKKPTLILAGGTLNLDDGHRVLAMAAYVAETYDTVAGNEYTNGTTADFDFDDWESGTALTVTNLGPDIDQAIIVWQWSDDSDWRTGGSITEGIIGVPTNDWEQDETLTISGISPELSTRTFRFVISSVALTGSTIVGEAWMYNQTRLNYRFDGESGTRQLYSENGALFAWEKGRYKLIEPGLVAPPSTTVGTTAFTMRVGQLNATQVASGAGGTGSVATLLELQRIHQWAQNRAAITLRLEFSGDYPVIWENYLDREGFAPAWPTATREGLVFWKGDDTDWEPFPFHFLRTQLGYQVRIP